MSKTIKVDESVYEELLELQQPRETFSEVVARCIHVLKVIQQVSDTLGPSHYLKERNPHQEATGK